jgi:hypothetical protein
MTGAVDFSIQFVQSGNSRLSLGTRLKDRLSAKKPLLIRDMRKVAEPLNQRSAWTALLSAQRLDASGHVASRGLQRKPGQT